MRYVLMCGGLYSNFGKHKALAEIHGEPLIERTIRLLHEAGVDEYTITVTEGNHDFDYLGNVVPMKNSYIYENGEIQGFWVDAFKDFGEPTCYICTDVYYMPETIKQIVDHSTGKNTLFGAVNTDLKPWQEPLAYKVYDTKAFFEGIEIVKQAWRDGKCDRHPLIWELYRVLNGININDHRLFAETYVESRNGDMDIDVPEDIEKLEKYYG